MQKNDIVSDLKGEMTSSSVSHAGNRMDNRQVKPPRVLSGGTRKLVLGLPDWPK